MVFDKLKNKLGNLNNIEVPMDIIKGIIDENTLIEIRSGKIYVPDDIVNKEISRRILGTKDNKISSIQVASTQDGKLNIIVHMTDGKNILLSGVIKTLSFNNGVGVFQYNVENHEMTGSVMASWILSSLTLGFMQKLIGLNGVPDSIDVKMDGNNVMVDFSRILLESKLGKAEFKGIHIIELLEMQSANSVEGGTEIMVQWKGREVVKEKLKTLWKK